MTVSQTVGLIAGRGQLPAEIARGARARGCRVVGLGLKGFSEPDLEGLVDEWQEIELGSLGRLIEVLGKAAVSDVVMAGSVGKQAFFAAREALHLDDRALGVLRRLEADDDDALLGAVAAEIENAGVRVRSQAEWVPHLLPQAGVLGKYRPSKDQQNDIEFGASVAQALGRFGAGQCAIVRSGCVLALEAAEGTDAAIRRAGEVGPDGSVVVKMVRPAQDLRFDLPAVGLKTLDAMAEARASVLAFEAGRTLVLDLQALVVEADRLQMVVVGVECALANVGSAR